MGKKLNNAPVYFALIQVRFNPVLALESYAAQIQESFRRNRFPDYQKVVTSTFNINTTRPIQDAPEQMPLEHSTRHIFSNKSGNSSFILDMGSLSFQTTNYDVFDVFSTQFLEGLDAVNKAVGLDYSERIGTRYLNAVFPKEGKTISDYLTPEILGLSEKIKGVHKHSFSETAARIEDTDIVARVFRSNTGGISFPPDLQPTTPDEKFRNLDGPNAIIDIDSFKIGREDFDLNTIKNHMEDIHDKLEAVFKIIATEKAYEEWAGK